MANRFEKKLIKNMKILIVKLPANFNNDLH